MTGSVAEMDVSATYFNGFTGLPVLRRIRFAVPDPSPPGATYEAQAFSGLPRLRMLGADLAAGWRGPGLWAEGAVVTTERIETATEVITGGERIPPSSTPR